jgi:hypothetical protein
MSYTNLIDSQLKKAFNMAKDLAVVAVFDKVASADFNFNTASTEIQVSNSVTSKVIVFDGRKAPKGSARIIKNIMVKAKDVGDLSTYDVVTFDSFKWTITSPIKGTGFIYVLEVAREG